MYAYRVMIKTTAMVAVKIPVEDEAVALAAAELEASRYRHDYQQELEWEVVRPDETDYYVGREEFLDEEDE